MIGVRDAIERTIVLSIGAASLTRERVEGVVSDFVERGHLGADEGRAMVDRVMARVRGEGAPGAGVVEKLGGVIQAGLKEAGVARRDDVSDLEHRLAALEHRVGLLEDLRPGPPEDHSPLA